jgi:hypothetical protein
VEYRVSWTDRPPSWWNLAWTNGTRVRARGSERPAPEARVDTYWIIDGRTDLGIKLRGGQTSVEIKVRYERNDGWELWEKVIFQAWTPLESVRCAALLKTDPMVSAEAAVPAQGVQRLLAGAGWTSREHTVRKTRLQADAHALLTNVRAVSINHNCLAEIVELRVEQRHDPTWSLCFESAAPARVEHNDGGSGTGLVCGYPELLSR